MQDSETLLLYGKNWYIYKDNIDFYKQYKKHTNCLYILFYSNGYVKVGKTQNFFQRFKSLLQNVRLYHNDDIIKIFVSEAHAEYHCNEKILHNFLSKFQLYRFSGNKSELFNISEKDIISCGQGCNILESKSNKINDINPTKTIDIIYTKEHIVNVVDFLKDIKENIEHNIEYFEKNNFSTNQIKWIYRSAMLDGRNILFEKYNKN